MQFVIMKPEIGFVNKINNNSHTKPSSPTANYSSQGVNSSKRPKRKDALTYQCSEKIYLQHLLFTRTHSSHTANAPSMATYKHETTGRLMVMNVLIVMAQITSPPCIESPTYNSPELPWPAEQDLVPTQTGTTD